MLRIHCPDVLAGAGYQGVDKRNPDLKVNWGVDMRPGKCKALDLSSELARDIDRVEQLKASIRAKVEHPFAQSSKQLFALSNLWMARRQLLGLQA